MIRNDSRRQDATKAIECRKFFRSLMFLLWIAVSSSPSVLRETASWVLRHTLREMNSPPNNNLEECPPISEGRDDAGKWSRIGVVVDASSWMLILEWYADLRYRGSIRTDSAEQPPRTAHRHRHRYDTAIMGACIGGGTSSLERYRTNSHLLLLFM